MTKQEQVDKVLRHYLESVCCTDMGNKCPLKPKPCEEGDICPVINRLLPDFKKDLSEIGVVVKVEREELPKPFDSCVCDVCEFIRQNGVIPEHSLLRVGMAVEPLVKEERHVDSGDNQGIDKPLFGGESLGESQTGVV